MIISIKREKNTIKLNQEFASAVPEFSDVLNDEKLGIPALAYVIYTNDLAEDNIYASLPEPIRKKEVAESLKIDNNILKDVKLMAAMKKYKMFCEQNVSYQFKKAHLGGLEKIAKYVNGMSDLTSDDATEFTKVLKEMPSLLKGKDEIEKINTKETTRNSARGGRSLTLNERG